MSGEGQIQDGAPPPADNAGAGNVQRPDYIPETIWDAEKNAPKIDLAATLAERDTLKTAAEERAAKIPAKPEDYKFDLPQDFELPEGMAWKAGEDDPLVKSFREYAVANKLTQDEVSGIVKLYASQQVAEIKNQRAFDAEQTKALGEKAAERRKAASAWIDTAVKDTGRAAVLKTMLHYAQGVEAIEDIIAQTGIKPRGNPGDGARDTNSKNAENAELIGKPGAGRALLQQANAKT